MQVDVSLFFRPGVGISDADAMAGGVGEGILPGKVRQEASVPNCI